MPKDVDITLFFSDPYTGEYYFPDINVGSLEGGTLRYKKVNEVWKMQFKEIEEAKKLLKQLV